MSHPLLELSSVTLIGDDRVLIAGANLVVDRQRVGLAGRASRLLEVFQGKLEVRSGELRIAGHASDQLQNRTLGIAFPLPGGSPLSVRDVLTLDLMLRGEHRVAARRRVEAVLAELSLGGWGKQRLGRGCGVDHYLAGLVRGVIDGPELVVAKWPVGRLGSEAWARYGTVLGQVFEGRKWLVGFDKEPWLPVERAWLDRLEVIVEESRLGFVARPARPDDTTPLLVTVRATEAAEAAFAAELVARGCSVVRVSTRSRLDSTLLLTMPSPEPSVAPTRALLAVALETDVRLVRLETLDDRAREGMLAGSAAAPEPFA